MKFTVSGSNLLTCSDPLDISTHFQLAPAFFVPDSWSPEVVGEIYIFMVVVQNLNVRSVESSEFKLKSSTR